MDAEARASERFDMKGGFIPAPAPWPRTRRYFGFGGARRLAETSLPGAASKWRCFALAIRRILAGFARLGSGRSKSAKALRADDCVGIEEGSREKAARKERGRKEILSCRPLRTGLTYAAPLVLGSFIWAKL